MDTSIRRTTDTFKPSTDTCVAVFLVKNTSKRNVGAENDSKLRIMEAKFLLDNKIRREEFVAVKVLNTFIHQRFSS